MKCAERETEVLTEHTQLHLLMQFGISNRHKSERRKKFDVTDSIPRGHALLPDRGQSLNRRKLS